ncbi:MAG: signal recognition particle-docking protein FtsY [Clostridia bacterium]|nr:signal recognition particle-docking protein FtsY [Clostridia bacterium]
MFFSKIKENLKKTKEALDVKLSNVFANNKDIDKVIDEIEETLILSDVGINTSTMICGNLRDELKKQADKSENAIKKLLKQEMEKILSVSYEEQDSDGKEVILIVGVNGVGKTTSIGKIANLYKRNGKKVLLAAADTFRAGAVEQLDIWAKRTGCDICTGNDGQDPASVIFDAANKFKNNDYDILICDTAGRLHNKSNLMNELEKINRIIDKNLNGIKKEVYIVLDATTGQNGTIQVKSFYEKTNLDGIILTKLDSTAKGGVIFSIVSELNVPIRYIGIGEQIDDIEKFNPKEFVEAIV